MEYHCFGVGLSENAFNERVLARNHHHHVHFLPGDEFIDAIYDLVIIDVEKGVVHALQRMIQVETIYNFSKCWNRGRFFVHV